MARAHSNAYKKIPYIYWPPAATPNLVAICGRTEARVAEAARRYGYAGYYTDWQAMLKDPRIQVFDNCAPHHLHVEPVLAALAAGKHVICEKPIALRSEDAYQMLQAARAAGVKHMAGFNYRFVPAVRLAYDLIQRGVIGEVYQFRGQYLQESLHNPDRPLGRWVEPESRSVGASGVLGCHITDMARFLVGEVATISALMPRFAPERAFPGGERFAPTWDDACLSLVEFENGAVGTIEASRVAAGRKNALSWEINGSRGSIAFDLERLNELQVYLADGPVSELVGFQDVIVTEPGHPFARVWWPRGHIIGWEHAHINELYHFLEAVALDQDVGPLGATLEDGYRAAVINDAMLEASASGRKVTIGYRE
jgi:predicted dehydrogenase